MPWQTDQYLRAAGGTDAVADLTRMCEQANQAALAIQRRLHVEGLQMVILPMKV